MKTLRGIVISAGIGLAVGGMMGILFAPRKGKATRRKICRDFNRKIDNITDQVEDLKEKMEDKLEVYKSKK